MNLNHIDLPVSDIVGVRAFFESHFGFRCIFECEDGLTVLLDDANFALTLSNVLDGEELRYPAGFHVGFNLESEGQLRGGALTFQCNAPGSLLVELSWRPR